MFVPLAGLLLLFLPLFLMGKYPGKGGTLAKTSVYAAGIFVLTGYLFVGVLLGFRYVQATVSNEVNPKVAITRGAFSALRGNINKMYRIGPRLLEPTMQQLTRQQEDGNLALMLLDNASQFRHDVDVFLTVGRAFKINLAGDGVHPERPGDHRDRALLLDRAAGVHKHRENARRSRERGGRRGG